MPVESQDISYPPACAACRGFPLQSPRCSGTFSLMRLATQSGDSSAAFNGYWGFVWDRKFLFSSDEPSLWLFRGHIFSSSASGLAIRIGTSILSFFPPAHLCLPSPSRSEFSFLLQISPSTQTASILWRTRELGGRPWPGRTHWEEGEMQKSLSDHSYRCFLVSLAEVYRSICVCTYTYRGYPSSASPGGALAVPAL